MHNQLGINPLPQVAFEFGGRFYKGVFVKSGTVSCIGTIL